MEDWEARSTLYRIMSMDAFSGGPSLTIAQQPLSPQAGGMMSPAAHHAAALFSPAEGQIERPMPPGEVHMDEIDLLECIGKGGYG